MKETSMRTYTNTTQVKLKNARCTVLSLKSGIGLDFKVLSDEDEPKAHHKFNRGVVRTTLKISNEAACGLYYALQMELEKQEIKL
jgi:hypothetical protein